MVSQVIATIFRSDLNDRLDPAHAIITEFKYLTSYNWLDSEVPTIVVPGKPFQREGYSIFRADDQFRLFASLVTAGRATETRTRLRTSVH